MPNLTTAISKGYDSFLTELKDRIRHAQLRAALSVNRELVLLYWSIGRDILARQKDQGWGAKVIDRLAADPRTAFPEMTGFSPRNLKYMRAFAETWPDEAIVQQVAAQIPWFHNREYALRHLRKPMGVSEYRLTESLPKQWKGSLPSIEELEAELRRKAHKAASERPMQREMAPTFSRRSKTDDPNNHQSRVSNFHAQSFVDRDYRFEGVGEPMAPARILGARPCPSPQQ